MRFSVGTSVGPIRVSQPLTTPKMMKKPAREARAEWFARHPIAGIMGMFALICTIVTPAGWVFWTGVFVLVGIRLLIAVVRTARRARS